MTHHHSSSRPWAALALVVVIASTAGAAVLEVPSATYPTIQSALDVAQAGDTVQVAAGTYPEALVFPRDGAPGLPITLTGAPGDEVTPGDVPRIDASGLSEDNVISLVNRSHIRIVRFEIRNHSVVDDGSAVRIEGFGTDLELRGLLIRNVTGTSAMAITVYGTNLTAISDLVIADCVIRDIEAAPSEAVTLNGNVRDFLIENNIVRDVNNIAIDMIGGETDIQPDTNLVARQGIVRGNTVVSANSNYEGGYAAGIYVDGGRNIVIEANQVDLCDLGIEIGAENAGLVTSGITVRNNQISGSERAGLVFGGFDQSAGRVEDSVFRGNTLVGNNTVGENGQGVYFTGGGIGEIWVQWGSGNLVEHNLVLAAPPEVEPFDINYVVNFDSGSATTTTIDGNLYWSTDPTTPGAGAFAWSGVDYGDVATWQAGTPFDAASLHTDPLITLDLTTDRYQLDAASPARNAATGYTPGPDEVDIDLGPRLGESAVDLGADEYGSARIFADDFELGDFTRWLPAAP